MPDANISLVWKDAATGFRIMVKGKTKAFIAALQDGSLKARRRRESCPYFWGWSKRC